MTDEIIKPEMIMKYIAVPHCPICKIILQDEEECGDWHYSCLCGQWVYQEEGGYIIYKLK